MGADAKRLATRSTVWTVGPHVRLVQYFGVAKATTKGTPSASESATEYWRRPVSGGSAVVISAAGASASVGLSDGIAFDPTAGVMVVSRTSIVPTPWIGSPPGSATSQ